MSEKTKKYLRYKDTVVAYTGKRKKKNIKTDENCVVVGVKKKKPISEIEPEEILPSDVDVIETPEIKLQHKSKHRPLVGGISGIVSDSTAATLGLIVVDNRSGDLVALTNNHCVGMKYDDNYEVLSSGRTKVEGLRFMQPSPYDGGIFETDCIGHVIRSIGVKIGSYAPPNYVDAGITSINTLNNTWFSIHNIGNGPFDFLTMDQYQNNDTVIKSGRTTGVTSGKIFTKDMAINVTMGPNSGDVAFFDDQIGVEGPGISAGGDSGSVVLIQKSDEKYHVAGLLFAGGTMDGTDVAICNHIETVANELDISPWDGTLIMPYDTPDTIFYNSVEFISQATTNEVITHIA